MRTTVTALLSAGVMAFSFAAAAADMPARVAKAPVVAPAPYYNWTGFYTVTGLGGAWTDIEGSYANPFALPGQVGVPVSTNGSKFNYATIIGAQYQWGNWVIGIEGAYNKLLNKDYDTSVSESADCFGGGVPPFGAGLTCASRIDNIWTVGGRLGYAFDRWMAYGTGGYANGKVYTKILIPAGLAVTDTDQRHGGWYAGAGAEYFLTKFWMSDLILGLEYQHIDLRTKRHFDNVGGGFDDVDYKATVDIVRARLVFKWTPGPAAVVAKY